MHENSDLARLVINSIRKDLDDHNEVNNCLALHAIATLGGKEMAEALSENVYRAMISQCVALSRPYDDELTTDQQLNHVCEEEGRPHPSPSLPETPDRARRHRLGRTGDHLDGRLGSGGCSYRN